MGRTNIGKLAISLLFMIMLLLAAAHEGSLAMSNSGTATLLTETENVPETRKVTELSPGVTHTEIDKGVEAQQAFYTAELDFFNNKKEALELQKKLRKKGFHATIHTIKDPKHIVTDIADKTIGHAVQVGQFATREEADIQADKLRAKGFTVSRVAYSEYDGTRKSTGPWSIDVLEIDPGEFNGTIQTGLGYGQIQGNEALSSMVKRKNAFAAVNGGYFVVGSRDGTPGSPAGTSVLNGELISESVGERTSLALQENNAAIGKVKTALKLETANGESRIIDGLNRIPGLIRSCGGTDDAPSDLPMHDVTCTDKEEIIQFTTAFGDTTPATGDYEVILDEQNHIVSVKEGSGSPIPESGTVLLATGDAADWLRKNTQIGETVDVEEQLFIDGNAVSPEETMNIVNGAPRLLQDGLIAINAKEEGFNWSNEFYYNFALYRHPRTLAGIKENGNLLFVTIDGRNPGTSIGLNFYESAQLLQNLGAVEGMNLDGGGSTTMVIGGELVNTPSGGAERAIAEGIFLME
ncbi:phosphodiester glycosidase family protein [Sediminibacillus albus]|uniref:Sporulation related domain-containing protein n=1 Tax=Sediminibacillus albus TaxID=407036 RepID=A0A1G9C646_9BACI|nr:phosphodiester glycosidase family protein [Sediminibacillus albus]SDK47140.1 Sporulation related domain-containing protein [Sediminibacillus albus]